MRPRDSVLPFAARPRARASLTAGGAAILAAIGGLIAAGSDDLGQLAGLAVVCVGVVGAMLSARALGAGAGADIDTLEDALAHELDRARRHRHSLALVRIAPSPARGRTRGGDTDPRPARALGSVRAADRLWVDEDGLVALLPETDRDQAERAAGRLLDAAGTDDLHTAIAVFPDDGLTGGALLAHLEARRHPTALAARRVEVVSGEAADGAGDEPGGGSTAIG
jgi:hypothetical protein